MRTGEARRQWNGPGRTRFLATRPGTAPGENHHAPDTGDPHSLFLARDVGEWWRVQEGKNVSVSTIA